MKRFKLGLFLATWFIIIDLVIFFSSFMPGPGGYGLTRRSVGGLQPASGTGPVLPTDLGLIMQYSGDQVVTLPDGAYTTVQVNYLLSTRGTSTPNSGGNGTYKGWLIIKAQNKWGATVDLTNNGMNLGPSGGTNQAYRIAFIGIAFSNGDFCCDNSNFITFAYCKFNWPASAFHTQYVNAGGTWPVFDSTIIAKMVNGNARCIGAVGEIGAGFANAPYCNFIRVFCCTFQTVGNDANYYQGVSFFIIQGCYIIDDFHHTDVLPNPNPALGALFHSDGWQDEWGTCGVFDSNTLANADLQIECNDSGIHNFAITNNWFGGSPNVMITIDEFRQGAGSFTGCVARNNRGWSGGQYQDGNNGYTANPSYDSGYDVGLFFHASTGLFELPPGWTDGGSNVFTQGGGSKPASVTVTAGLITDLPNCGSETGDSTNPAATFQAVAAQTYANIITFIGSGRTVTDGVYSSGSNTVTSVTANFTAGDEGVRIQGTGIRADCYIHFVNSTTITLKDFSGASINAIGNSGSGAAGYLVIGTGGWN